MYRATKLSALLCAAALIVGCSSDSSDSSNSSDSSTPSGPRTEPAPKPQGTLFQPDSAGPKIAGNRYVTACGALPPQIAQKILGAPKAAKSVREEQFGSGDRVPSVREGNPNPPMFCRYELGRLRVEVELTPFPNTEAAKKARPEELKMYVGTRSGRSFGRVGNYTYMVYWELPVLAKVSTAVGRKWSKQLSQQVVNRVSDPKSLPNGDYFPAQWGFDACKVVDVDWFERLLSADPSLTGDLRKASQDNITRDVDLDGKGPSGGCGRAGNLVDTDQGQGSVDTSITTGDVEFHFDDAQQTETGGCRPLKDVGTEAVVCEENAGSVAVTIVARDDEHVVSVKYRRNWDLDTKLPPSRVVPAVEELLPAMD